MFNRVLYGTLFGFPILRTFLDEVGSFARVRGNSMQPTLNPYDGQHDFVVINRWMKYNIFRGDVVVLISPRDPRDQIIKRVIALEGDVIFGRHSAPVVVPKGYMWIEGDNSYGSVDSNEYGPVPLGLVIGKAQCIIWPPNRIRSL